MKPSTAMIWKEWRETRIYLWIGLGVFLGLPAIAALEDVLATGHRFYLLVSPILVIFGGVLAVFTAVGATCRDLKGRLEDFWRSQPVNLPRWMLTKYLVGLAVVLIACMLPAVAELCVDYRTEVNWPVIFGFFPFHWAAVYSLAFAAGCLLRRPAHAAMMGLAGMLLVWFLPLVLPPLRWMNTAIEPKHPGDLEQAEFAVGMLVMSALAVMLAVASVRFGWQIKSGVRLLYSSIAGVVLLLLASASYQLGTDLPVLQKIDLPDGGYVQSIYFEKNYDVLCVGRNRDGDKRPESFLYNIRDSSSGIVLEKREIKTVGRIWNLFPDTSLPDGTPVEYEIDTGNDQGSGPLKLTVHSQTKSGVPNQVEMSDVKLWNIDRSNYWYTRHFVWQNRLYVIGMTRQTIGSLWISDRLAILDIRDPQKPEILSITPLSFAFDANEEFGADKLTVTLPLIPGLEARGRMKLALNGFVRDGDNIFSQAHGNSIIEYHLAKLTDAFVEFDKIASHEQSMIEIMFGVQPGGQMMLRNGFLYQMRNGGSQFRSTLCVYDTRGPRAMQMVAHFATPQSWDFCPLPDGRVLVGGYKLWVVGPPPKRAGE